ncbi:MAG: DUF4956 domain-containing protein [Planctomycetes bacterium]|nr:DUF4956 domain-containing protein [Planctomycetota bacterium]
MAELLSHLGDFVMPSPTVVLFHLLLAFVLAKPVAWVYVWTHHGTSYSRSFVQALVLLAVIVALVMLAVGDSMARAFGLFGALALIRFRTPIKDSRDTVFLFLAVAIGITVGTANPMLAIVGTTTTLAIAGYLYGVGFGARRGHDGVLRLAVPAQGSADALLQRVLTHYCRRATRTSVRDARRDGEVELSYQVRLFEAAAQQALILDLRALPGVHDVMLLLSSDQEEA